MGKKKRGHPDVEELLGRPWCYYCERDFEDLKLLISHQKAKHFKCDRCGKRLNTAGGLSVHMNQVHKENLTTVENALPNRQGLDIEIFGMEGVPEDIIQQHNQRIIQSFYTAQAERQAATGNPPRGQSGDQGPTKKIKYETPEELKKRLAEHRARVAAQKASGASGVSTAKARHKAQPLPAPQQPAFGYPAPSAPPYNPTTPTRSDRRLPIRPLTLPGHNSALPLPNRPPGAPAAAAPGATPYYYNGSASTAQAVGGDDIDQLIRMAEAGIKPAATAAGGSAKNGAEEGAGEKKKKGTRMVYADTEVSPEEKMAMLPRYRWVEGAAA
ncbi:hypothetical protein N0V88_005515 [Collariella sp. IMI 366227]|nr:hypothetical protein N0V88_005515 [Collariella sp. IMI 366227]